ncbi:hypothetical protein K28_18630 [Klebsiella pneumoniae]|nr:hypothetical protein K28_18630 [Klebsiella pneumoniae]KTG63978.1 hypothetical protein K25_21855 [Klebsiella pneumoniae]
MNHPTLWGQSSSAAGHHQCTTGQKYHQNHNKRLYSRFQPAIRYFVISSIAFFIDEQIFFREAYG